MEPSGDRDESSRVEARGSGLGTRSSWLEAQRSGLRARGSTLGARSSELGTGQGWSSPETLASQVNWTSWGRMRWDRQGKGRSENCGPSQAGRGAGTVTAATTVVCSAGCVGR